MPSHYYAQKFENSNSHEEVKVYWEPKHHSPNISITIAKLLGADRQEPDQWHSEGRIQSNLNNPPTEKKMEVISLKDLWNRHRDIL